MNLLDSTRLERDLESLLLSLDSMSSQVYLVEYIISLAGIKRLSFEGYVILILGCGEDKRESTI